MVLTCQLFYKIWNMKNIFMLKNSTTNTCFRGWVQNLNFCLVHKNLGKKAKEINFVRFQKSRLLQAPWKVNKFGGAIINTVAKSAPLPRRNEVWTLLGLTDLP